MINKLNNKINEYINKFGGYPSYSLMGLTMSKQIEEIDKALKTGKEIKIPKKSDIAE